jgi:hypothetical protein
MFYPGRAKELSGMISHMVAESRAQPQALPSPTGLILPHAGYAYSGKVAASGYKWLAARGRPEWAIILGTNHTGLGRPISIQRSGGWRTPLGVAPIVSEIADQLVERGFHAAESAFAHEHSVEVQLPFLQYLFGADFPFVPICVKLPALDELMNAGEIIAQVLGESRGVLIASSDFTHYQPQSVASQIDRKAIDRILSLDGEGFYNSLVTERLSICGGGAITILIQAAHILGLGRTRLLSYRTSGDVTGDKSSVVGYAAIALGREDNDQ